MSSQRQQPRCPLVLQRVLVLDQSAQWFCHWEGYRRVRLAGKNFKVHRLVAEAFVPNPDNLPHVIHIDGNRTNNHFSNLKWSATQSNRE